MVGYASLHPPYISWQLTTMKQFRLFTSNRLEILIELLAKVLRTPLESPLVKETIVVQSKGMERWVAMELARRHGICANIEFLFPNKFVYEKIFSTSLEESPYAPEIMTWKIMECLLPLTTKRGFKAIRNYLKGSGESLRRFQLSDRIARLYDQYLLFRPDMISKWEEGKDSHWQAALWRKLVSSQLSVVSGPLSVLTNNWQLTTDIPERISVFGISGLPRFHIKVFDDLSSLIQVNLFLMNPCEGYWGDILSNREKRRLAAKHSADRADLHLEEGNSLLASMGMLGRDFFHIISEFDIEEHPLFQEPDETGLLSCIQSDIMNLRERGSEPDEKTVIAETDMSVQIHSCHSPMREIEVLHDRLLEMFDQQPDLEPGDILVMTPDIEVYAPYIQAVFDLPWNDPRRIPFSIADRSIRAESRLVDTFLRILELTDSRFGAGQLLSILELPAVYQKFELSEADIILIHKWVQDTRIRWGIDGQNREKMGLPGMPENTWRTGLDRLLLGYAMPGKEEKMFEGILPYDFIEGSDAAVLGKFIEFTDRLFSHVRSLELNRSLAEWSDTLKGILDEFFDPGEDAEEEAQKIRTRVNSLADIQCRSGFGEEVDINIIRSWLGNHFKKEPSRFGFITGGITFCAMLPMRSIPFRIICLTGMNSDAYPRQSRPADFDLMAKHPRRGDPSRRNDDRYLFLESVLSARETLYISYVGQSIRDNSVIPPSVLVSEFTDTIERGFEIPGKEILEDQIITNHRLQAFSPAYFTGGDSKLFSYSEENFRAAKCLTARRETPVPFISEKISEPESEWKTIGLDELCLFFNNPARFMLNRRLGIYLDDRNSVLEEKEPFEVSGLDKYFLEQHLVEKKLEGQDLTDFFTLKKAAGQLPHGTVGECVYEKIRMEAEGFAEKIQPYIRKKALEPFEVDLNLNGFTLNGRIETIYPDRLFHYRCATVKPKDRLRTWIHHLVLNYGTDTSYPRASMFAGSDFIWEYRPVRGSQGILESLLEKYWEGLRKPIHFFPKTSWEYADRIIKNNAPPGEALKTIRNTWMGNDHAPGEAEDSYFRLCFGQTEPFDTEFHNVAIEIFEPLLMNSVKRDA
ncbi:exodeoxyribonuclease V subunit gamma [Desulfococcaceae bacterium HSG8]|nr:exodeoxyribonuclease V subunit gamma [Desulfococcaceae bacterium HSG8]